MKPGPSSGERILIEVFREHRGRLWHFFWRGTASQEAAEDLLQETFLRVWSHREQLGAEPPASGLDAARRFVWRVARNLMIDEVRYRQRARSRIAPAAPEGEPEWDRPSSGPGPAASIEHADCVRIVREVVERLPHERSRRCLQLWLEDVDLRRIGEETGLQIGQVRGLLQRAKSETIRRAAERLGLAESVLDRGKGKS